MNAVTVIIFEVFPEAERGRHCQLASGKRRFLERRPQMFDRPPSSTVLFAVPLWSCSSHSPALKMERVRSEMRAQDKLSHILVSLSLEENERFDECTCWNGLSFHPTAEDTMKWSAGAELGCHLAFSSALEKEDC